MFLKKLKLINFKNYEDQSFEFCSNINCLVGLNASGKTNILDAIYYLSFTKSYFSNTDSRSIRHGEDFFAIHGFYEIGGEEALKLSLTLKKGEKKNLKLNEKTYSKFADHIGLLPLVMISPYDRDLINEGSDIRRKYLDSVIAQFDKVYLSELIRYNKVLKQRNVVIKNFFDKRLKKSDVEIWNEQLARLGNEIFRKRKHFIELYIPIFQKYFDLISDGKETVSLEYNSDLHHHHLEELLASSIDEDIRIHYTTKGIHKDDLLLKIDQYPIKRFGSQGQQKSYVIAMKLAQFEYTKDVTSIQPILLMDDIFDKLDEERVTQIINMVKQDDFGQIFISDTHKDRILNIFNTVDTKHKIYEIAQGKIVQ
jgi:DNA replication and repair protein RecF